MNPEFKDETPLNPFDFYEGANFKMKMRQVDGFANYDKSEFASVTPLCDGKDADLEEVWKQQHSLQDLIDPESFKSYQELEARFNTVVGGGSEFGTIEESNNEETVTTSSDSSLDYFKKLADSE